MNTVADQRQILDLYELDSDWSDDQKAVTEQVARFVDAEVLPKINEYHNEEKPPLEIIEKIKDLGIVEAIVSEDLDPIAYGLVMRELERGSSALRSVVSVQSGLVVGAIKMFGSDAQKETWLGPLGRLDTIGCFGLTEPDFGSNPGGMKTKAERIDGGYRISGHKCWITSADLAHIAVVWAKLDDKINGFLVETDRKGFEPRPIKGKWSFRSSDTGEFFLDQVEIPEENKLPHANSLGAALKCLNQARYGIAWGVIGAARGCFEEAVNYLVGRPQFNGKPLASHQLIQNKLAWMAAEITGMELLAKRLGELKASGRMQPRHVSIAKMNNCRKAIEIARTCRELLGANGIHSEYHVGRRMVDLETVLTYEGTEHIHSLIVGQSVTGIPAYA